MKNKAIKMACLAGALMTTGIASQIASAGVIANAAATSNYVWRGVTQTANGAAISGGVDYNAPFGIYVGTWVSNTAFGSQELDIYAGWAKDFG
ncbi:MAG: TorF family putative porin, partial [Acidiferrobacterales bacterium]